LLSRPSAAVVPGLLSRPSAAVVPDLLSRLPPSCPCRPCRNVLELMLFDFSTLGIWPGILGALAAASSRWTPLHAGLFRAFVPDDSAPLVPAESWFIAPTERRAPTTAHSAAGRAPQRRLTAHALRIGQTGSAISAAAQPKSKKRLVIRSSPHVSALPARQRRELHDVPG